MPLFERPLVLLAVAVVLLQAARRLRVPYPAMLALAGGCVAALPFAPHLSIEPRLALALFVAPVVMDTALDMPPVETVLIEDPDPNAPYGVKGVGEPPTVVSTAAVVAALRDATGRELHRAPVRLDEIVGL